MHEGDWLETQAALHGCVVQVGVHLDQAVYGYIPTLSVETGGGLFVTDLQNTTSP